MSYEIIEINQYGVLVKKIKSIPAECEKCKYTGIEAILEPCKRCKTDNSYYLTDQEATKIETEITPEAFTINDMYVESKLLFDCQDKLNDLQLENKKLKERIKELENNTTELITEKEDYYGAMTNITTTKCCGIGPITNENFCPNCGRKIVR